MTRLLRTLLPLCLFAGVTQADETSDDAFLKQLFELRSPAPDWRQQLAIHNRAGLAAPSVDAPIEDIVLFWRYAPRTVTPDAATAAQLLTWCESHLEDVGDLLWCFPTKDPSTQDRLRTIEDRLGSFPLPAIDRQATTPQAMIHQWLMTHSRYHREDLIKTTREAFSGRETFRMEESLRTLMQQDRPAAEQLLRELAASSDGFAQAAAVGGLLAYGVDRENPDAANQRLITLQAVVTKPAASPRTRSYALQSLMRTRWPGQEQWFLELFKDGSLGLAEEGSSLYQPLSSAVAIDPDRWIPRIVPLVGGADRVAHNNAVLCLSAFNLEHARADALRPLLPWLQIPDWAEDEGDFPRLRVVQSLPRVHLPESVPGLMWLAEHETRELLSSAAEALVHYQARDAGRILKAAIPRETDEHYRRRLIESAIKLGALSTEEKILAIGAFIADPPVETLRGPAPDPKVSIGKILANSSAADDALVAGALRVADDLATSDPKTAQQWRILIARWQGDEATRAICRRLAAGNFSVPWVTEILDRRSELAGPIGQMENLRGIARGIQVAMTGQENDAKALLGGNEPSTQFALLAGARYARTALPLPAVAALLDSTNAELAAAAESYLVAEDSPAAREIVLRRHPGEARILGHYDLGLAASASEERIRALVRTEDGPREIIALLSQGGWGNVGQRLLLIYDDRAVLLWFEDGGRQRERQVTTEEVKSLQAWLTRYDVDALAPFDQGAMDGIQYEYLRVTRAGGRRVFMNNPPGRAQFPAFFPGGGKDEPDPSIYGRLVGQFERLGQAPMTLSYKSLSDIPGFRILHPREQGRAVALAGENGRIIVRLATDEGNASYHALKDAGLDRAPIEPPAVLRGESELGRWAAEFYFMSHERLLAGTGLLAGQYLWAAPRSNSDEEGLWVGSATSKPRLLASGWFLNPVLTPDGEWIVTAKANGINWASPNGIVRIHVRDQKEQPVALPFADDFQAIGWNAAYERVLLRRAKDVAAPGVEPGAGPDAPEFYLYDPVGDTAERVEGEFSPLLGASGRSLQPAKNLHETWAAMPASESGERATIIGRYNTRAFKFTPVLTLPGVDFQSSKMWIDETTRKVTMLITGDIVQVDLP